MISPDAITQLKDLLSTVQTVFVMVGPTPTFDQVACATSLYLALSAAGKDVLLASPTELSHYPDLFAADQAKQQLGNQNLSVSFEYQETAVDKVSYHIDETSNKFYLVIKPQKGAKPLDTSTVELAYTGAEADLLFLVGVHNLESLDQLYLEYEELYQHSTVVTYHTFSPSIGTIKLDAGGGSSLSEPMVQLLQQLELPVPAEAATNLLAGIEDSTQGFTSLAVTAETFETVAHLLRSGARRLKRSQSVAKQSAAFHQVQSNPQVLQRPAANPFAAGLAQANRGVITTATPQPSQVAQSFGKNPKKSTKPDSLQAKPGSLKFQPTGFGPGGAG